VLGEDSISLAVAAADVGGGGMSKILQFMLILGIIIIAAKLAGYISTLLRQPAVLGELLVGVILGPSLINIYGFGFLSERAAVESTVKNLAELGVIMLMFMAGLEVNLKEMFSVGKVAVFSGTAGVIVPIAGGAALGYAFGYATDNWQKAFFIGLILAATSVSISVQTMVELGVIKKKEGVALLGAAVFDDILVVMILSFFVALFAGNSSSGGGFFDLLWVVAKMVLFFVIIIALGLKFLPWLLTKIKKLPISEGLIAFVLAFTVLISWAAEFLSGIAMIVGAFTFGALLSRTKLKHEIEEKVHSMLYGLLVPIFFVSIGLIVDVKTVPGDVWIFAILLTIIAILTKIIGCGLGAMLGGFNFRSSLRVGVGMVSRGEVGLIVAGIGLSSGFISNQVYAAIIVVVLATTLFTPFGLKWVFKGADNDADKPGVPPAEEAKPIPAGANHP
jgi:Kef-type K+ transport system membrane component KefB